jgi:heat shock protein HtpX
MKRIFLFVLTNLLVMITISIVITLLGVGRYMTAQGIQYQDLAIFCLVWGMGGSLFSLMISKISAKWSMGIQIVDKTSPDAAWLVLMVEDLARKAGLPRMPEVGIYDSPEVNAFATGPSRRNSLVAFSTGLLRSMNRNEIEGVAAHEVAHIANGDMVTMTLLQGIVNAFVMFFARVIAYALSQNAREENRYMIQSVVTIALDMALGFLGMIVVCGFSRWREFRADAGGAAYAGRNDMIAALERLASNQRRYDNAPALATLKISGGVGALFSTHPPLEKRIAALRAAA